MKLTQNQIKALKEKCPKCEGNDLNDIFDLKNKKLPKLICPLCKGTGKATIKIEKEYVKQGMTRISSKEISKYKVGDNIHYCNRCETIVLLCSHKQEWIIKLKIISETEKNWIVMLT